MLQGWIAETKTPGRTGRDDAFSLSGDYNDADWTFGAGYTEVGADFNPEVGFLTRRDYRKFDSRIFRRVRPANGPFFEIRPHIIFRGFWDFEGFQETGFLHMDTHWEFHSGREFHTGVNLTLEGLKEPFDIVPGVTIQPGTYEHEELQLVYLGDLSAPFNFQIRSTIGGRWGGDRVNLEPTFRYRVGDKLTSEFSYAYNDFDLPVPNGQFTADLWRLRVSYSFTPRMLLQLLTQYNEQADETSSNLRFSWLQSANAGLYFVYNEIDEEGVGALPKGREFVIKYSRIFDLLR
jgi:hypothetical protein